MSRYTVLCLLLFVVGCNAICSPNIVTDENYWTPERMATAIPRHIMFNDSALGPIKSNLITNGGKPFMRDVSPAPEAPCEGIATKITDTSEYQKYPLSSVGKVYFSLGGYTYVCSGSAAADNQRIWTAGHCVFDPDTKEWVQNFVFYPAFYNNIAPLGKYTGTKLCTTNEWYGGDISRDFALVNSDTPFIANVRTLSLAVSLDPEVTQYYSYGYPQGAPFNGMLENICDANFCRRDPRTSPRTVAIVCDSTGGCSGGPWIKSVSATEQQIVSVNSYGYTNQPGVLYGPYFDEETQKFYDNPADN